MSVKKMEKFEALSSIKDTLIPILWFEEGIDEGIADPDSCASRSQQARALYDFTATAEDACDGKHFVGSSLTLADIAMFEALHDVTRRVGSSKPVQGLLEGRMACGFGVCYSCAVFPKRGGVRLVCTDGPRFELRDLYS